MIQSECEGLRSRETDGVSLSLRAGEDGSQLEKGQIDPSSAFLGCAGLHLLRSGPPTLGGRQSALLSLLSQYSSHPQTTSKAESCLAKYLGTPWPC